MHTEYIYKIKEEYLPKLSVYRIWRKSLRTQRVRLIHGKRAIGVRAIEVLLYLPGDNHPVTVRKRSSLRSSVKTFSKGLSVTFIFFETCHFSLKQKIKVHLMTSSKIPISEPACASLWFCLRDSVSSTCETLSLPPRRRVRQGLTMEHFLRSFSTVR